MDANWRILTVFETMFWELEVQRKKMKSRMLNGDFLLNLKL